MAPIVQQGIIILVLKSGYVEQFSIDKKLLLKGDSFNITIKGQSFQKYYLYFENYSWRLEDIQ